MLLLLLLVFNIYSFANSFDTKPLKIAYLVEPTPFNYVSGYANRFRETLTHLSKAGDTVKVITADNSKLAPTEFSGFPIQNIKGFALPQYPAVTLSLDTGGATGKMLKTFKPDILHVSSPGMLMMPAAYYAWRYKIPLVYSFHTNLPEYVKRYRPFNLPYMVSVTNFYLRRLHNRADLTLATSPQLKQSLESDVGVTSPVEVWRKGVNCERFSPSFKSTDMRWRLLGGAANTDGYHSITEGCSDSVVHTDKVIGLYVGRLSKEKRLDTLVRVLKENPALHLAIAGTGPVETHLKDLFIGPSSAFRNRVTFLGTLTGDELSGAYATADMLLFPSDSETLGFAVMESLASGTPAVALGAGGLLDVVMHSRTGFLASPADDMKEFSEHVSTLVSSLQMRQTMGSAAREWALNWSWDTATRHLRNVHYTNAIKECFGKRLKKK